MNPRIEPRKGVPELFEQATDPGMEVQVLKCRPPQGDILRFVVKEVAPNFGWVAPLPLNRLPQSSVERDPLRIPELVANSLGRKRQIVTEVQVPDKVLRHAVARDPNDVSGPSGYVPDALDPLGFRQRPRRRNIEDASGRAVVRGGQAERSCRG